MNGIVRTPRSMNGSSFQEEICMQTSSKEETVQTSKQSVHFGVCQGLDFPN